MHTLRHKTEDATVNACFDADRLDLGRVGITPNPDKMAVCTGTYFSGEDDGCQSRRRFASKWRLNRNIRNKRE